MSELIENENLQDIINIQNSTINKLKSQIDIYKIQVKEQSEKISSCDHLIIDYNSLYNNYINLEKELSILRKENNQLRIVINTKNKTLNEFQYIFLETKSKFILYDKLNESLQNKIKYLESQLKSIHQNININTDNSQLNDKINEYYLKIKKIKDEYNEKEDYLKREFDKQIDIGQKNDIIFDNKNNEHNDETSDSKIKLNIDKKTNENILLNNNDINDINKISEQKEINKYIIMNQKLEEQNKNLKENLNKKEKEIKNIILNMKNENEEKIKEIKHKENIINNISNEKENLLKEINNKDVKQFLLEKSYKKKYETLKEIVDKIEKEKNNNKIKEDNKNNAYKMEISSLKNEIKQYINKNIENTEKCTEIENKYKNRVESIKKKEEKYKKDIGDLNKRINIIKKENDNRNNDKQKLEIIKRNKELIEKNSELSKTLISLRNHIKNIGKNNQKDCKNNNIFNYSYDCAHNNNICNFCCCNCQCILLDECYGCQYCYKLKHCRKCNEINRDYINIYEKNNIKKSKDIIYKTI